MVHRRFSSAFYHAVSGMNVTTIPRDKLPWGYNNWRGISEDLNTFRGILLKFKTKETSNQIKVKYHEQPLRSQSKKKNKTDQVAIGISFESYWLTGWHKFSKPIKWRGKAKPKVFRVISGPWNLLYEEINISDCSSIFQTTILDKFLLLTRENFQFDPRPAKLVSATTFPCSTLEYLKWKLRNVKIIQ